MRFKIEIQLENEQLSLDYRPAIISMFKHCLTVYEDGKHFDNYYEVGKEKPFTFAVGIPSSKFTKEMILVPNRKINITFSTGDIGTGIVFFNALLMQKNKSYPLAYENAMIIKNISIEKEYAITTDTINVTFKSPLCVREHNKENNKDIYYSYEKDGFNESFNKVLKLQIANSNNLPEAILEGFSIIPISCKKTVIRHHSQFIESTIGIFKLTGNIALLSYLYTNGIGSRKSSGFGMFEVVGKEKL
ncbi:CRISPR-associated endoribonuclease Cas6 [Clostridium saccharoperbutylacetonicum]|uniref:CRISPR-associated endoribonuclease Cas6 n=1 Tax=Clostridium saccharoperbutylacetonicum TaxID=36745 RepID=UPI000983C9DA|nr:CRISPR-associated endoribonuclease Cas6 [Clostridium saccharoperbutylacetonicum]AQR96108.1 CRISPR associated protein Cas6 [Clostridium saccharoperbutylacetonicum]NSB31977.1 CRISPR-associated endoribonuclease Cas6 [Clostridium saccharoperbutylacetonicum]